MKKLFILLLALMLLSGCSSKAKTPEDVSKILEQNGYFEEVETSDDDWVGIRLEMNSITDSDKSFLMGHFVFANMSINEPYVVYYFETIPKNSVFQYISSMTFSDEEVISARVDSCEYDFPTNTGNILCSEKQVAEAKQQKEDLIAYLKEMDLTIKDIYDYLLNEMKVNNLYLDYLERK